jgi:hypothetical protein
VSSSRARVSGFVGAAQATLVGDVFDDAATGQGLLNFFFRAINCGADRGRGGRHDRRDARRASRPVVREDSVESSRRRAGSRADQRMTHCSVARPHVPVGSRDRRHHVDRQLDAVQLAHRNLRPSSSSAPGIYGDIWLLHSGAFYFVEKTSLSGQPMPRPMHWFKWRRIRPG